MEFIRERLCDHAISFLQYTGEHTKWSYNVVFSSIGCYISAALLQMCTSGYTMKELEKFTGYNFSEYTPDEIIKISSILTYLLDNDSFKKYQTKMFTDFEISQKLFEHLKILFNYGHTSSLQNSTNAPHPAIQTVKFDQKNQTIKLINQWLKKLSKDKMIPTIQRTDIANHGRIFVVSACYFRKKLKMNLCDTTKVNKPFFNFFGEVIYTDYVTMVGECKYFKDECKTFSLISIPFKDDRYEYIVMSPNFSKVTMKSFLQNTDFYNEVFSLIYHLPLIENVKVTIPKMKLIDKRNLLAFITHRGVTTLTTTDCNIGKIQEKKFHPISRLINTVSVIVEPIYTTKNTYDLNALKMCSKNQIFFDHPHISMVWDKELGVPIFSSMTLSTNIRN